VLKAIANVESEIAGALRGMDVDDQEAVDGRMIDIDGTDNKARLGANATIGCLGGGHPGARGGARASSIRPITASTFRSS